MTQETSAIQNNGSARLALVLGATGGIGGAVAAKLAARGYRIRALSRNPEAAAARLAGYDWVKGDAMERADVIRAAAGASLIVHAVNPPGYRRWEELVMPMLESTIAAAEASGARILLPGTVYNYGPDSFPNPAEDSPQRPLTRKGAIRVEMESRLARAAKRGVKVLIVRAGDFFGPGAGNNWFAQGLVKPGKPVRSVTLPGAPGIGHQWAYLPDLAEAMVRLAERGDALEDFARFHFGGIWDHDGRQMLEAIRRASGAAKVRVARFPWPLVWLLQPFVPLFSELQEMRYLWKLPVRMKNDKLVAYLGEEPHTPLDEAVKTTLASLGCLKTKDAALEARNGASARIAA